MTLRVQVMFTMPLAPLVVNKTSGDWMWTAASVLSMNTPELEFNPSREASDQEKLNGLSYLESFTQKILAGAFQESALFWHYALRHVPSDSLICAKEDFAKGSTQMASNASLYFTDKIGLSSKDEGIAQQAPSNGYPMYGYAAFPVGASNHGCMCGWPLNAQSKQCEVPWPSMCLSIGRPLTQGSSGQVCSYDPLTLEGQEAEAKWSEAWQAEWPCPSIHVSDGWGIVPASDSEEWIKLSRTTTISFSASLQETIYSGRAGLRIGNMQTLANASRYAMHPTAEQRNHAKAASQKRCVSTILGTFDPVSLANDIADDLIPAAQAVSTESWPVSVCLRFSIEFLRLRVLKTLQTSQLLMKQRGDAITQAAELQQAVVQSWKHKCESQLGMVAVCQSNGIFDMVPSTQMPYECPFTISNKYDGSYYVGPSSCLLYTRGSFYDPCLLPSNGCTGQTTLTLAQASQEAARLKFDVRSLGNGEVLGTWPIKFTGTDSSKNEVAAAAALLLEEWKTSKTWGLPWRLSSAFAEQVVEGGGTHANSRGSIGNTRLQWSSAEGFANVTMDYCDGMAGLAFSPFLCPV